MAFIALAMVGGAFLALGGRVRLGGRRHQTCTSSANGGSASSTRADGPIAVPWGLLVDACLGDDDPDGDGGGLPHPPLLDGVHVPRGRRRVRAVLHLPEPLHRRDADAGARRQPGPHVRGLGRRGARVVPPHRLLVHGRREGLRRAQGLRHQPHRRLRLPARPLRHPLRSSAPPSSASSRPKAVRRPPGDWVLTSRASSPAGPSGPPSPSRPSASSWAPPARARSSRSTSGCPTPWPARPRSRPSSTPPPWSPPASTWSPAPASSSSLAPASMAVVTFIGAVTALFAAIIAFAQYDLKRVLAYSTVSQLGFMFIGVGAGVVLGRRLPPDDARLLQGLPLPRRRLASCTRCTTSPTSGTWAACGSGCRSTGKTFLVATLAITGIVPLSGFFSKDAILAGALFSHNPAWPAVGKIRLLPRDRRRRGHLLLHGAGFALAFAGPPRTKTAEHAHESAWIMTLPLWILAFLSVVALRGSAVGAEPGLVGAPGYAEPSAVRGPGLRPRLQVLGPRGAHGHLAVPVAWVAAPSPVARLAHVRRRMRGSPSGWPPASPPSSGSGVRQVPRRRAVRLALPAADSSGSRPCSGRWSTSSPSRASS